MRAGKIRTYRRKAISYLLCFCFSLSFFVSCGSACLSISLTPRRSFASRKEKAAKEISCAPGSFRYYLFVHWISRLGLSLCAALSLHVSVHVLSFPFRLQQNRDASLVVLGHQSEKKPTRHEQKFPRSHSSVFQQSKILTKNEKIRPHARWISLEYWFLISLLSSSPSVWCVSVFNHHLFFFVFVKSSTFDRVSFFHFRWWWSSVSALPSCLSIPLFFWVDFVCFSSSSSSCCWFLFFLLHKRTTRTVTYIENQKIFCCVCFLFFSRWFRSSSFAKKSVLKHS